LVFLHNERTPTRLWMDPTHVHLWFMGIDSRSGTRCIEKIVHELFVPADCERVYITNNTTLELVETTQ